MAARSLHVGLRQGQPARHGAAPDAAPSPANATRRDPVAEAPRLVEAAADRRQAEASGAPLAFLTDLGPALDLWRVGGRLATDTDPAARRVGGTILAHLRADTGESLADALGLTGPGRTGARRRLRIELRDAALRQLAAHHWPELSPTAAGAALATAWLRYAASGWPRDRLADDPPTARPAATFYDLMRDGHAPIAAETARKILARVGQFHPVELTNPKGEPGPERS